MIKNREIAKALEEVADIMEIKEIEWKPRAYRSAARSIKNISQNIEDIYKKKGKKGLKNIPSIGNSIAQHIAEYIDKGKVKKWENIKKKSKKGIHNLVKIEGLGPKKVKKLSKKLNIYNIQDLKDSIKNKKIRKLKGFGKKTEENIKKSLKQYDMGKKRIHIDKAQEIAEEIIKYLKKNTDIKRIEYAGSLRRFKETIGDIDLLAITNSPKKTMNTFSKMPQISRVILKGKTKTTVTLKEGINIDLRIVNENSFGAAMQYFTGSKEHNIKVRKIATKKGYKLSEYGLFNKKTNKKIAGKHEKEIYKKIDLKYIPPELRENRGEIKKAQEDNIPKLIDISDIKGDLQMHTKYSDGYNTIKDMAKKAKSLGYNYIAITDHSKSEKIAKGMRVKEIKKQIKEINKLTKKENIKILKGAEVDILKNGKLDYNDNILNKLDIVLVSIHSGFKLNKKDMTKRILKALDNKYVNIFAHPTGRLINKREGYNIDLDKVFKKCKENNIAVEINSDPNRLDLNDQNILKAKKYKLKFSLGTDAHNKNSLHNIKFGIGQAKRGYLNKNDIINTMEYDKLIKFLKKS